MSVPVSISYGHGTGAVPAVCTSPETCRSLANCQSPCWLPRNTNCPAVVSRKMFCPNSPPGAGSAAINRPRPNWFAAACNCSSDITPSRLEYSRDAIKSYRTDPNASSLEIGHAAHGAIRCPLLPHGREKGPGDEGRLLPGPDV